MNSCLVWNGYTLCPEGWGMTNVSEIFHRIYYVYGGEAYCTCDGKMITLEKGKLYIFPIMHPYTMWQNPEDPLDVLWFHVETDTQLCGQVTCLDVRMDSTERYLLEAIRTLSNDVAQFEKLLQVFQVLLTSLSERLQLSPYPGKQMCRVLEYIQKNIQREISVKDLAEYAGMERSYFSRKFKSIFHMPPNQYITARKMKVAAGELMAGATVYHAASTVGYADEKAFSRAFKRYMEITPGRYRAEYVSRP